MSEKKDSDDKHFLPETLKKSFLEKYDHIPLSEKEKLLRQILGTKVSMNQWMLLIIQIHHTNEEHDELFDKITNKLTTLKKLVKIVSNAAEKKKNK